MRSESDLVVERLKVDAQMAAAEIQTRSQVVNERIAAVEELYRAAHQQLHEGRSQSADQQHAMVTQSMDQQHERTMQAADQAHELNLAQQQQAAAAQQPPQGNQPPEAPQP
jgi:hypothetical protein